MIDQSPFSKRQEVIEWQCAMSINLRAKRDERTPLIPSTPAEEVALEEVVQAPDESDHGEAECTP